MTAQVAVEGDPRGSDDLDDDTARAWGILLADLHDRGATVQLPGAPSAYAEPPTGGLAGSPRTPPYVGLLHGDPEIDNVVWTAAGGTFVDLDDVRHGWYVGDVGYALRDWAEPAGPPDLTAPVPRAFLAGYRSRRTLTDEELSWLPAWRRPPRRRRWPASSRWSPGRPTPAGRTGHSRSTARCATAPTCCARRWCRPWRVASAGMDSVLSLFPTGAGAPATARS